MKTPMSVRGVLVSTRVGPLTAHVYLVRRERTAKDKQKRPGDLDYAVNLLTGMVDHAVQTTGISWVVPVILSTELEPEDASEVEAIFTEQLKTTPLIVDPTAIPEALERYQRRKSHFFVGVWLMRTANNPANDKLMELH